MRSGGKVMAVQLENRVAEDIEFAMVNYILEKEGKDIASQLENDILETEDRMRFSISTGELYT